MLRRSYRITDSALEELGAAGLDENVLAALRPHKSGKALGKKALDDVLSRLGRKTLSSEERKLIRKYTQLGMLRLEWIIPNRSLREWIEALVFAVAIAMVVRTFVIAPFKIPSGSMIPTIQVGDHIFATMFSYGVPVPFTDIKLFSREVHRGDIIIFPYPLDPSVDYIKRVIAREGETVAVRNGKVLINGDVLNESYAYYDESIMAQYRRQGRSLPDFGPVRVPPGHLFVMGDNRLNSSDSRVWGFVSESAVKGKGQIVYWSHDPREGWMGGYHLSRIGTLLQ